MTKRNKLIDRFKSEPNDFTFDELVTLLGYFGYYCDNKGKTSGSRIRFRKQGYEIINLHKAHNRKNLLNYEIKLILNILKRGGLL